MKKRLKRSIVTGAVGVMALSGLVATGVSYQVAPNAYAAVGDSVVGVVLNGKDQGADVYRDQATNNMYYYGKQTKYVVDYHDVNKLVPVTKSEQVCNYVDTTAYRTETRTRQETRYKDVEVPYTYTVQVPHDHPAYYTTYYTTERVAHQQYHPAYTYYTTEYHDVTYTGYHQVQETGTHQVSHQGTKRVAHTGSKSVAHTGYHNVEHYRYVSVAHTYYTTKWAYDMYGHRHSIEVAHTYYTSEKHYYYSREAYTYYTTESYTYYTDEDYTYYTTDSYTYYVNEPYSYTQRESYQQAHYVADYYTTYYTDEQVAHEQYHPAYTDYTTETQTGTQTVQQPYEVTVTYTVQVPYDSQTCQYTTQYYTVMEMQTVKEAYQKAEEVSEKVNFSPDATISPSSIKLNDTPSEFVGKSDAAIREELKQKLSTHQYDHNVKDELMKELQNGGINLDQSNEFNQWISQWLTGGTTMKDPNHPGQTTWHVPPQDRLTHQGDIWIRIFGANHQ